MSSYVLTDMLLYPQREVFPMDENDGRPGGDTPPQDNGAQVTEGVATDREVAGAAVPDASIKRRSDELKESLERILAHAESHGEVYHGAIADLATVREAIKDAAAE